MDPLYEGVGDRLAGSTLPLLDIGCGSGLLCFYLLERGIQAPLHGLDFDEGKIMAAQQAAGPDAGNPRFHLADARSTWPDVRGHVTLLDVLHYLAPKDQETLLKQAASHVLPAGRLVIRSGIKEANWRYRLTLLTDRVMNRLRFMKSPPLSYPGHEFLVHTLADAGLELEESTALYTGTPFNNHLLVFKRPQERD